MQIYSTKILDTLEKALDCYHNKLTDTYKAIDVQSFSDEVFNEINAEIKHVEEVKKDIHLQNNRLKYQALRNH